MWENPPCWFTAVPGLEEQVSVMIVFKSINSICIFYWEYQYSMLYLRVLIVY